MKRFLVLSGVFLFASMLSGCTSDTQGDAVQGVVQLMNRAAGDISNIGGEVDKAIKKHDKDKTPLDLTEAARMATKLAETGKNASDLKSKQIDKVKLVDGDEKKELADRYRSSIRTAFDELLKSKTTLNESLMKAEAIDKDKVEELRTKIREAEGPFEALARQS